MTGGQDDEEQVRQKRNMKCKNFAQGLQRLKQNEVKETQTPPTPRGHKAHFKNPGDCCPSRKKQER